MTIRKKIKVAIAAKEIAHMFLFKEPNIIILIITFSR